MRWRHAPQGVSGVTPSPITSTCDGTGPPRHGGSSRGAPAATSSGASFGGSSNNDYERWVTPGNVVPVEIRGDGMVAISRQLYYERYFDFDQKAGSTLLPPWSATKTGTSRTTGRISCASTLVETGPI